MWNSVVMIGTGFVSVGLLALVAHEYMRLQTLPHLPPPASNTGAKESLVSLLIPARNEARNIGRCLDGALRQSYHPCEVIVVDDGSTDATPEIVRRYAAANSHLHVIAGQPLPPGWAGKCHACQQASSEARGDWLLFLDADTVPQPELVAAMVAHAERHEFDLLTLFPFLELGTFWERVILPPFQNLIQAVFPFARVNAPDVRPEEVLANGQCILVRRAAYEAIGGHAAVYDAVLDDVLLAQTVRRAGFRTGAVVGLDYLRVRMYTNGREVVEGLTKNAVAGFHSGGVRSLLAGGRLFSLAILPLGMVGVGAALVVLRGDTLAWAILSHGVVLLGVEWYWWGSVLHRLYALPRRYALLWQFGLISYGMIALRSLWSIRSGRGVVWKGRRYAGT